MRAATEKCRKISSDKPTKPADPKRSEALANAGRSVAVRTGRSENEAMRSVSASSASLVVGDAKEGHDDLKHDQNHHHQLQRQRPRGVDLALEQLIGLREQPQLARHLLLPRPDAQLRHRRLVD